MAHLITGYAGSEHIKSADQGAFNAAFFGEGQFVMEIGSKYSASITDNSTVRVLDGDLLMYGRHIRIEPNTYEDMTIVTGTAGYKRIDLVVMTYEKDMTTGIESAYLEVIKGTQSTGTPTAPSYIQGNILTGATKNQMPLYKVCIRSNASGVEANEGTYLKASIDFSIASVNSKNTKSWSLQYKKQSDTTWTALTSGSVYSYNSSYVSTSGIISADYAYDIKLVISDFFTSAEKTIQIGTAFTLIDFRSTGKGIAFGKVSAQDAFECALKIIASNGFQIGNTNIPEPSSISITLGGTNFKKTSSANYEVLPMTAATVSGSRLTLSSNGVLIGAGVTKVKVSGQICYGAATAGLKTCAIWSSASNSHLARTQMNISNASLAESLSLAPRIVDVSPGNLITLRCHGTVNDIIYGGLMQTYLTVEVV